MILVASTLPAFIYNFLKYKGFSKIVIDCDCNLKSLQQCQKLNRTRQWLCYTKVPMVESQDF